MHRTVYSYKIVVRNHKVETGLRQKKWTKWPPSPNTLWWSFCCCLKLYP